MVIMLGTKIFILLLPLLLMVEAQHGRWLGRLPIRRPVSRPGSWARTTLPPTSSTPPPTQKETPTQPPSKSQPNLTIVYPVNFATKSPSEPSTRLPSRHAPWQRPRPIYRPGTPAPRTTLPPFSFRTTKLAPEPSKNSEISGVTNSYPDTTETPVVTKGPPYITAATTRAPVIKDNYPEYTPVPPVTVHYPEITTELPLTTESTAVTTEFTTTTVSYTEPTTVTQASSAIQQITSVPTSKPYEIPSTEREKIPEFGMPNGYRPIVTPNRPWHTRPTVKPTTQPIRQPTTQPITAVTTRPWNQLHDYNCRDPNSYYSVPTQCDAYVECQNNIAIQYECRDGLLFNPSVNWPDFPCSYPSEVKCESRAVIQDPKPTANCPRRYGFFPMNNGDCGKYIMCQEGLATAMNCPPGLAFNSDTSSCDWPVNVPGCLPSVFQGFTCPEPPADEGSSPSHLIYKYRHGNSCRRYFACQKGQPRLLSCDVGLYFDENTKACVESSLVVDCNE